MLEILLLTDSGIAPWETVMYGISYCHGLLTLNNLFALSIVCRGWYRGYRVHSKTRVWRVF